MPPAFVASDLLTSDGFKFNYDQTMHYFQTHYQHDSFVKCLSDPLYLGTDHYFPLQLLHLMASAEDRKLVELLMAAYASTIVSNPEHLLAMDTTVDYRGDSWTSRDFNYDAYEVGKLFHRRKVDPWLFMPFVKKNVIFKDREMARIQSMDGISLRKYAMKKVIRHKIYSDIAKKLNVPHESIKQAMAMAPDGKQGSSLMAKISDTALVRNKDVVLRAVGVSQDWKLLAAAIERFPQLEVKFMKSFLIGTLQDCGRPPIDELRAVAKWG